METSNNPGAGGNPTNRPGNCSPFTVEFTTSTGMHKVGEQQYVESTDIKIGRSPECDIRFGDDCKTVSREHARIRCMGGRYVLEHLSASNETYVNGKNVTSQYVLSHRDTIQFSEGGPKILFIAPGAVGSNAPAEAPGGQKTERSGSQSNVESNTQRPSAGTSPVRPVSPASGSCLPFTIEFEKKSQMNYAGQRRAISETEVLIGRSENALIRFGNDCNEISTEHAVIRCKGGQWVLEHKSRTNETYLNGRPVPGEATLSHGSIIHLSSLQGQSIRFYLSGSAEQTGRVQQGGGTSYAGGTAQTPGPSLSTRLGEMISRSNRTQRWISFGLLGGLIVTLGLLGWSRWNTNVELEGSIKKITDNQMTQDSINEEEAKIKYLEDHFPEEDFQPFVFFADGKLTLEKKNRVALQLTLTGSSFITNKGKLITARHVIRRFDYPEDCSEAVMTRMSYGEEIAGYSLTRSIDFASPILQETVSNSEQFILAVDKPNYQAPGCNSAKTCSINQDWAIATPGSLSHIKSNIEVDRQFSKDIPTGTKLIILGYRDSKSSEPQIKEANLSLKEPMQFDNSNIKLYKINNPSFGPGDSGAPVFAFNKEKKKWVVVGIVRGGEGSIETTMWGIILPICVIPDNLLN